MHIVARARAFVESLRAIARRSEAERRRCRVCRSTHVHRHGTYPRRPYTLEGRQTLAVQRYRCQGCGATHSDEHPDLIPGAHYSRGVRRHAIDHVAALGTTPHGQFPAPGGGVDAALGQRDHRASGALVVLAPPPRRLERRGWCWRRCGRW